MNPRDWLYAGCAVFAGVIAGTVMSVVYLVTDEWYR